MVCDKGKFVVGGGGRTEEARDTESKTRTPYKVVGKNGLLDCLLSCADVRVNFCFWWYLEKSYRRKNGHGQAATISTQALLGGTQISWIKCQGRHLSNFYLSLLCLLSALLWALAQVDNILRLTRLGWATDGQRPRKHTACGVGHVEDAHGFQSAEAASFASLPMLLLAPQKLLDKKTRTVAFLYVDNLWSASRVSLNCPVEAFVWAFTLSTVSLYFFSHELQTFSWLRGCKTKPPGSHELLPVCWCLLSIFLQGNWLSSNHRGQRADFRIVAWAMPMTKVCVRLYNRFCLYFRSALLLEGS